MNRRQFLTTLLAVSIVSSLALAACERAGQQQQQQVDCSPAYDPAYNYLAPKPAACKAETVAITARLTSIPVLGRCYVAITFPNGGFVSQDVPAQVCVDAKLMQASQALKP